MCPLEWSKNGRHTILGSEEQTIQVPFSSLGNIMYLDHCLCALNHANDPYGVLAAPASVWRRELLDARGQPGEVRGIVGFGQSDGLDVCRSELYIRLLAMSEMAQTLYNKKRPETMVHLEEVEDL
jgi:hypothetical protein